jgi:hypothetical protein
MVQRSGVCVIEPGTDRGRKLAGLVASLKVTRAQLAEADGGLRSEQLRDVVQGTVSQIPMQEREAFLRELMDAFPTWSSAGPSTPVATPGKNAADLKDPTVLVGKLVELAKGMTDSQKSAVAGVLATAGLSVKETIRETVKVPVPGSGGALPEATQAEIRKLLKLAPDAPISAERLAEVSAMLVDFTLRLEQWGCSYWRSIAPEARTQLFQVLERDLAKFLAGDEKTTRDVVGDSVHNVRSLVSLLMKSAGDAGKQFSRDHVSRFAVQEIEREASTQAGVFKSMPVVAWEIYKRMMADMSAESMDKRFAGLIAKDVDAALGGVVRKRRT